MSLESIFRVVSHAQKSASEQNGGTPEEQAALDVLGGLTALLEARIQLHKHASPATTSAEALAAPAGAPRQEEPVAPAQGYQKQRTASESGDSYDLK
jgi:hypothetical protein